MTSQSTVELDAITTDLREESPPVRAALSALGRLLGAALIEPPRNLRSFIASNLGTARSDLAAVSALLPGVDAPLVQVAVARLIEASPAAVLADDTGTNSPGYTLVPTGDGEQLAAPDDLAAFLPAGPAFDFDVVIVLTWFNNIPKIELNTRRADQERARAALAGLIETATGADNFYRGRTLQVSVGVNGIEFTPIRSSNSTRAELVQPPSVWAEVDANIGGLAAHGDILAAAGLGASRGILIAGPPGVGKTALCRVIAAELPPETTVLLVDAGISARGLGLVYESLNRLAPAAVFLDDIDLLAGDRRQHTEGGALRELLTHLDGFTPTAAVVTVATTNVVDAIDPALIRAGRFDSVIEVGRPDQAARVKILARYLDQFGSFDLVALAQRTDGASGADLREVVRRGVLERGAALTTHDVLEILRTGRWQPVPPTGQYL